MMENATPKHSNVAVVRYSVRIRFGMLIVNRTGKLSRPHIPHPARGDDDDEPSLPRDAAREDAAPAGAAGDDGEDEHFDAMRVRRCWVNPSVTIPARSRSGGRS